MNRRLVSALLLLSLLPACNLLGITNKKVDFRHPVVTTETGVEFQDVLEGEGAAAQEGDAIEVHVTATVVGRPEPFFASADGGTPLGFELGAFEDLSGLNEGLLGMKVGGVRRLLLPPARAYGPDGVPGLVPADATIQVEAELLTIRPRP